MSTTTPNLGLFKYDTTNPTDLASAFNINTALNNNWDIIDNLDPLPDQTGKSGYLLTTDGTNANWDETSEVYCVVETFQDGTDWYRVWSDGWCEQGGYKGSTSVNSTVNLLKNYIDTNYSIQTTIYGNYTNISSPCNNKTTSSFTTYQDVPVLWQASGYIEV